MANLSPVVDEVQPADQPARSSNLSQSALEQSLEMEDPKYRLMEQSMREKDEEVEKLQIHNQELDSKLQRLLNEFAQFRAKAHQMLTLKEEELDKLKGRGKSSPDEGSKKHVYDLDSGYESSTTNPVLKRH